MGTVVSLDEHRKKGSNQKLVAWFIGPNRLFKVYLAAIRVSQSGQTGPFFRKRVDRPNVH